MTLATQTTGLTYGFDDLQIPFVERDFNTADVISFIDIQNAAKRIKPYIRRTPTVDNRILSDRFNANVYLKLELLQNTGAFKVRGAFNKMLTLTEEERERGIVAVSGGNHAKAVAYAAKKLELKALILMPEFTPENYLRETRNDGAEIELFPTLADAFERAGEYVNDGLVLIHPFDDALVIAGQGTAGLEILEDVPQVTDVIVSVGGGGLSCGVAMAIKAFKPDVNIWGVETKGAESMAKALDAGRIIELAEISSIAKTLGAQSVGRLNFALAKKYLEGVTVVSDEEAVTELFYLLDRAKVLTEPATSCTLAAAERLRGNFGPDSHVVLILCGGNIGLNDLFQLRSARFKGQSE